MNALIAVQDLITVNQKRIKVLKQQIRDHEEGVKKLSVMAYASAENALEKSSEALEKNQLIYNELKKRDLMELEKEERLKEAVRRNNYYKYQKVRLKRDINKTNDQKLEAMMIVDELPSDVNLEDEDIFELAATTIKLDLRIHDELDDQLNVIKRDFDELLKEIQDKNIIELGTLKAHIPILVLHLAVLVTNIEENIKDESLPPFKGLPMFEDWWINELWSNHQAYFGLYKWKSIITSLCITSEQKRAWESIFANWIFIKKVLNKKGPLAFELNFAFDSLVKFHTQLEEQTNIENLKAMESIIKDITTKEDFNTFKKKHNIMTPYLEFKKERLDYISENS
jgi:hypothetical protein